MGPGEAEVAGGGCGGEVQVQRMLLSGLTLREYLTGFALHATPEIKLYKYQVPQTEKTLLFWIFFIWKFVFKNIKS